MEHGGVEHDNTVTVFTSLMGARLCGEEGRDRISGGRSPTIIMPMAVLDLKEIAEIEKEDILTLFPVALSDAPTGWDSSVFSCGVGIIDEQHCALFQIAANLQFISDQFIDNSHRPNAMTEEGAREKVSETLHYLARYANRHFITEEMLILEHDGSQSNELATQKHTHALFSQHIVQVTNAKHDNTLRNTIIHLLAFVRAWLVKHIFEQDQPNIRSFACRETLDFNGHQIKLTRGVTPVLGNKSKWNPFKFGTSVPILDQQLVDIFQLMANAEARASQSSVSGVPDCSFEVLVILRQFEAHLIEHFRLCEELSTEYGVNNVDWSRLKNNRFLLTLRVNEKRKQYRRAPTLQVISELREMCVLALSNPLNRFDFTALLGGRSVSIDGHLCQNSTEIDAKT